MFKHILLPTDGSELSERAVDGGLALAAGENARVTVLTVVAPFHVLGYRPDMVSDTRERYARESELGAKAILARAEGAAARHGVACDTLWVSEDDAHAAIVRIAAEKQCDLIAMASHGRRGMRALLLGSETQKVLTHSTIPVLVYR